MVDWQTYFKSFVDARILEQADFVDLWAIWGSTAGNKIAINVPNVFRQTFELDLGGEVGKVNIGGGSYANSVAGNDEMYLGFL
jgi:hypothetical protein